MFAHRFLQHRYLPLLAILLIALGVRLFRLNSLSLWSDEFFSILYPRFGAGFMWGPGLASEPTSPVYYQLIGAVQSVADMSVAALRAPSVLGSLLEIALVWAIGWTLFGSARSAGLAALLLALAPSNLALAQQVRSYALQGAALGLAFWGLALVLRGERRRGLLCYVVGGAASVYLHPTSVLALAGLNGAALFAAVGRGRVLDGKGLLQWCGAGVAIGLLCLPLLPVFVSPQAAEATAWIDKLSRWTIERTMGNLLFGSGIGGRDALAAEIGLPLLAALVLLPPWRPGRAAFAVLVVAPALSAALILGVSVVRPILLTRTVAWLLAPLCLVLGDVLRRRGAWLAVPVVAVFAAVLALQISTRAAETENWPGLLSHIEADGSAMIVLAPHTPPSALMLYGKGLPTPVRLDDGSTVPEVMLTKRLLGTETVDRAALAAAIGAQRRVWLIYRRPELGWLRGEIAGLPAPDRRIEDGVGNIGAIGWN